MECPIMKRQKILKNKNIECKIKGSYGCIIIV